MSLLKKSMAGAAGAVIPVTMEAMKSSILAERSARLQQYQTNERLATQEFQAGQLDKRLEAQQAVRESDLDFRRTSQEETARHHRALEANTVRGMDIRESAAEAKANTVNPVGYPRRQMVLDAEELIKGDPELSGLNESDRRKMAFNVATRTQKILLNNRGTDASEAMSLALEEEMHNFMPGEQRSRFGFDLLARDEPPKYRDRRSERTPQEAEATPPPEALAGLQEGMQRRFANGQVWTLQNGQPVRMR